MNIKKSFNLKVLFCLILILLLSTGVIASPGFQNNPDGIRVTVLYDNYIHAEGTRADWGFSCLVEGMEKTILFDTGTRPDVLWHNIGKLNIDISRIEQIVLSHEHGDHTGCSGGAHIGRFPRQTVGGTHVVRIVGKAKHRISKFASQLFSGLLKIGQGHLVPTHWKLVRLNPGNGIGQVVNRIVGPGA